MRPVDSRDTLMTSRRRWRGVATTPGAGSAPFRSARAWLKRVVATTKHDTPTSNAANEEVRGLPSGYDDVALYTSASEKLVGALWLESFSSASAHGSSGESLVGHGLPAPEALCNCACFAESNFAYCQNTAKTTVGVSTYAYNGLAGQWEAHNLRYFKDDSPGAAAGRKGTTFVDHSVLPDGPGGRAFFDIAYEGDMAEAEEDASGQSRSVEVVRGYTSDGVQCEAAPLCNAQCAGVQMYEAWRAKCDVR
mmetsp:Transcript_34837/g.93029  ORF Transcript_34837/g.93029 Transcript_34837/m.93029 type:complete len:250 (+) Transcript_34837:155-904(+)